jgi:hypothetical protein
LPVSFFFVATVVSIVVIVVAEMFAAPTGRMAVVAGMMAAVA